MRLALILWLCWTGLQARGQYYFQDIVVARQAAEQFGLLKKHKINTVTVQSFEADDSPIENFSLLQRVNAAQNQLVTQSKTDYTGKSELTTTYNPLGMPVSMVDSTNTTVVKTTYEYDAQGRLVAVHSHSYDEGQLYVAEEDHLFTYNAQGHPTQMLRIKRPGNDTLRVVFVPADNGKPGEEQWWRGGRKTETWYYYYDEDNNLTDIARYNARAKAIIPDYLFEYDEDNRLGKQTTVVAGSSDYR
ncbi:MAG TPA: hypothetical protein PKD90_10855, partial [Phnomibacter sp.]|nr:hypothetical protein [Phnomibacter sp.]